MKNKVSLIEEYKLKYSKENTFALQKNLKQRFSFDFKKISYNAKNHLTCRDSSLQMVSDLIQIKCLRQLTRMDVSHGKDSCAQGVSLSFFYNFNRFVYHLARPFTRTTVP